MMNNNLIIYFYIICIILNYGCYVSCLVVNVKDQDGGVIKEIIYANITDDTITVELQLPDSTLITQHIDFTKEVQVVQVLLLGEEERGQKPYQILCFVNHVHANEFISPDAMSKLRQKNPGTIRVAEENKGVFNVTIDMKIKLKDSNYISQHVGLLCSEAQDTTFTSKVDIDKWANVPGFVNTSADINAGIQFLQSKNIIEMTNTCENGQEMFLKGLRWRCQQRDCRKEKGIRVNNWLNGSRLPINSIVYFIYSWAHELTSVTYCKRELGIGKNAVVDWNNYLREVCVWRMESNNNQVGGPNLIVEIDESLFVRRKNNAGRILPQQWVFGGICRETKECL